MPRWPSVLNHHHRLPSGGKVSRLLFLPTIMTTLSWRCRVTKRICVISPCISFSFSNKLELMQSSPSPSFADFLSITGVFRFFHAQMNALNLEFLLCFPLSCRSRLSFFASWPDQAEALSDSLFTKQFTSDSLSTRSSLPNSSQHFSVTLTNSQCHSQHDCASDDSLFQKGSPDFSRCVLWAPNPPCF